MNQIANFGSELGNFIFVETNTNDYQGAINDALGESLDIALGSNTAVKFKIENLPEKLEIVVPAEINYVSVVKNVAEEEAQKEEEVDMEEPECEVLVTAQEILKTSHLNDVLKVTMLTKSGEYECAIKVDAVEEPEVEILIKARL